MTQASNDIGVASRTSQAVGDIRNAAKAANAAGNALQEAFTYEDVTLVGTGSDYVGDITAVSKYLTLAAEDAGQAGTSGIQFAQDELATYLQLSENAVRDYAAGGPRLGLAAATYALGGLNDLSSALGNLETTEMTELTAQRGAWPLNPEVFWWALLLPVAGMLLLTAATVHVLARHFRRHVSWWLWGSLLVTAATAVTVGVFNQSDELQLSSDPWAGYPAVLACALLLFLLAAVLAHLAYRPRLAEYRFESS